LPTCVQLVKGLGTEFYDMEEKDIQYQTLYGDMFPVVTIALYMHVILHFHMYRTQR
jgi:hypothetical protein